MSTSVLVLGESGSGKSTSMRNLDPESTVILNTINKPLPFKGWKTKFKGKIHTTDKTGTIIKTISKISEAEEYKHIKTIIIDDAQYLMANEFMRRAGEKGYEKFTEMANHMWSVCDLAKNLREDLIVILLSHSETVDGRKKMKTIGKMLDDKITLEGMFTIVLYTEVDDGYFFRTQTDGYDTCKSPMDMFESARIDNDLQIVIDAIKDYE